jgi:endoglucanase
VRLCRRVAGLAAMLAVLAAAAGIPDRARGRAASPSPNALGAASLYVDPDSPARRQADTWRPTRPADATRMEKIAAQPQAAWFGDWNDDVGADVATRVAAAARAHAVPVLVAYDIPKRDCGGHAAGGARSAAAYRRWIRRFATGLGRAPAAVVLEPDAAVYLDAGHATWQSPDVIASRLLAAGVAHARGFSLNVSNFDTTRRSAAYGARISAGTRGKPFVIDTSRNGAGPTSDGQWCNPPGRALGRRPSAHTGRRLVDAYLWIKTPGESDGHCNGGPAAGVWWPDYAVGLARRATW